MDSGATTIALSGNDNSGVLGRSAIVASGSPSPRHAASSDHGCFLRIPPFPGARIKEFRRSESERGAADDLIGLVDRIRTLRVGGSYWAAQPELPAGCLLVRSVDALRARGQLLANCEAVLWCEEPIERCDAGHVIAGECDPWHMLSGAAAIIMEPEDELRLIAAIMDVPAYLHDKAAGQIERDTADRSELLRSFIGDAAWDDPFSGAPMGIEQVVELCGFWRGLIDSNRDLAGGFGFAFWKQDHVAPLLWGGRPFHFLKSARDAADGESVAVWRAKTSPEVLADLDRVGISTVEVEDGFLRSQGLGSDCVPPLSITVDRLGPHFDPAGPSELELLLQDGSFDEELIDRARGLRQLIVDAALGKYGRGGAVVERPAGKRRHILVPGQVEDDRAVQSGGCGLVSNLDLLSRVRSQAPDAYILYKPHPDVVAGHRRGVITRSDCLREADEIVRDLPISSLIAMVDEVHVNTSLAGFEALLREKAVTTYGVPFYAGWGLTTDLGPVPSRRTSRRCLDELVAATLLLYPRYLDPLTRLPCPAEVVVESLSNAPRSDVGLLFLVRRLQGKLMRGVRSLVE